MEGRADEFFALWSRTIETALVIEPSESTATRGEALAEDGLAMHGRALIAMRPLNQVSALAVKLKPMAGVSWPLELTRQFGAAVRRMQAFPEQSEGLQNITPGISSWPR
eukprot:15431224-Alexandrium_andersonii.AAC.1